MSNTNLTPIESRLVIAALHRVNVLRELLSTALEVIRDQDQQLDTVRAAYDALRSGDGGESQ